MGHAYYVYARACHNSLFILLQPNDIMRLTHTHTHKFTHTVTCVNVPLCEWSVSGIASIFVLLNGNRRHFSFIVPFPFTLAFTPTISIFRSFHFHQCFLFGTQLRQQCCHYFHVDFYFYLHFHYHFHSHLSRARRRCLLLAIFIFISVPFRFRQARPLAINHSYWPDLMALIAFDTQMFD